MNRTEAFESFPGPTEEMMTRAALDTVQDLVAATDLEGRLLYVNLAGRAMFGLRNDELLAGRYFDQFYRPQDSRKIRLEGIPTAIETGGWCEELEVRGRKGRRVQVFQAIIAQADESGEIRFLTAIGKDNSNRNKDEDGIQTLTAALAHALDGIAFIDLQGKFQFVNDAFASMVGLGHQLILGHPWKCVIHPEDLANVVACHETMLRGDRGSVETRTIRPGDEDVYLQMVMTRATNSQGRLKGFYLFTQDITSRKRAESDLATRAAELARSNAELEQFAYIASHDLQEPLRMVSGFTKLLVEKHGAALGEEAREFIGFAQDGVKRMQQLIHDLLEYSRVDSRGQELCPTDLNSVLDVVQANLDVDLLQTKATLVVDDLPTVQGDAGQLNRLFQNLISNAIRFRGEACPAISVEAIREKSGWVIAVRDNGIGIEQDACERVFEIFQRLHTRAEVPGTGIGLAIARKIVERHGGRIWIDPNPDGGSVFRFTLPA